jgi:hypothetical protein
VTTEERAATHGSNRVRARRGSGLLVALVGLAGLLAAAACGSTPRSSPTATPTVTDSASATASAVPSPSPSGDQTAAIIAAYQGYIAAVNNADAATSGVGAWNTPALSTAMVNPLLQQWQSELMQEEAQGIMVEGTIAAQHPRVVSDTGPTAEVSDCEWDATVEYYKPQNGGSAEVVPNQPGGTEPGGDGLEVDFTLVSGKWMASSIVSLEVDNCVGF